MNFVLKPSLEHMALVKISISLWNQNDVRDLISSIEKWKIIKERVQKKVSHLLLPQLLKEKVLGFIKNIGLEILKWIRFHCRYLPAPIPAEFCWTPQGTVDRKRTAAVLVRDENLDVSTRYKLACIYCMEDDIIQFWNRLTEDLKESVSHSYFPMIFFWSRSMRRIEIHIDYRSEFEHSAECGNKVAAEYFLQKLTPTERKESLVETAKYVEDADTLCFLISEMDEEQQMELFRHKPYRVLESFLQWPWQSFFIEIASCMWSFLSKSDYENILRDIIMKTADVYEDWNYQMFFRDFSKKSPNAWNYQMLFREFWQKSPNALKSFITNEMYKSRLLLPSLFLMKDREIIRLIFKDASFTDKSKLFYSDKIDYYFTCSIRENEWDFLEFFIRECSPSKNEMLKYKAEFEKRMSPYFKKHFATIKPKWNLLFCFSDDSICKCDKRSLEEGESSSSKQFRCLQ